MSTPEKRDGKEVAAELYSQGFIAESNPGWDIKTFTVLIPSGDTVEVVHCWNEETRGNLPEFLMNEGEAEKLPFTPSYEILEELCRLST